MLTFPAALLLSQMGKRLKIADDPVTDVITVLFLFDLMLCGLIGSNCIVPTYLLQKLFTNAMKVNEANDKKIVSAYPYRKRCE